MHSQHADALLRLQISDYVSDAPGGHCSLQLLAKCSCAHCVPQGLNQQQEANQHPMVEKGTFPLLYTLSWSDFPSHSANNLKFDNTFQEYTRNILEIVHAGVVNCRRVETLGTAHLLAFPAPTIDSARLCLSFCLISVIRILTWQHDEKLLTEMFKHHGLNTAAEWYYRSCFSYAAIINGSPTFMHFELKAPIVNVSFALRLKRSEFPRGCLEYSCCG